MMEFTNKDSGFSKALLSDPDGGQINSRDFAYWYPNWEVWNFRRSLSYWIAMLYLEGSTLFIVGAYFSMTNLVETEEMELALVAAPYFVGGIAFTLGSYAGILNVVNIPNKDNGRISWCFTGREQWNTLRKYLGWEPLVGYICYMVGALFFNVNTTYGLGNNFDFWTKKIIVDFPAVLGSILFTAGGFLECYHNAPIFPGCDMFHVYSWLGLCNFTGGFFFLFAAVCNMFTISSEEYKWLVDFTYLIGSIIFAIGSLIALWLWKGENYGLGLISELNVHEEDEINESQKQELILQAGDEDKKSPENNLSEKPETIHHYNKQLEQYGCGRASVYQLPWLWMYILNSTASVLDVSLSIETHGSRLRIMAGLLNFALSHGILMLGSVVHHIPTASPHNWLLIYLRFVLLIYTFNSWWAVCDHISNNE